MPTGFNLGQRQDPDMLIPTYSIGLCALQAKSIVQGLGKIRFETREKSRNIKI
jgi:hypothetical protein